MRDSEIFLRRTDQLASAMRRNVDDLATVIGISRASLYGYRRGQRNISSKAWLKLEDAEKAAGIVSSRQVGDLKPSENAAGIVSSRKDCDLKSPVPHVAEPEPAAPDSGRMERLEAEIGGMRAEMARMASALEALAKKTTTSSPDRGRAAGRKKGA